MCEGMPDCPERILLIGYGNPGRGDDGLGPCCGAAVEALKLDSVRVEINYQLNVEDAAELAGFDLVIFADASVDCVEPFAFTRLAAKRELNFSTHSVAPAALLAMADELFNAPVVGYTLAIRGYRFNEFVEELSEKATENLRAAVGFLQSLYGAGKGAANASDEASVELGAAVARATASEMIRY